MFSLATGLYQTYFAPPKLTILVIGLDGAGKTALVERIKVTDIRDRIDVNAAPVVPPYGKGDAVAVCGRGRDAARNDVERPRRPASSREGSRPARLPPPLPPPVAARSRQAVDHFLDLLPNGRAGGATGGEEGDLLADVDENHVLVSVPPPPLADDGAGGNATAPATREATAPSGERQQLPQRPKHDSAAPGGYPPSRRNSFIELLRCPSPGKYAKAATAEEEEEYRCDDEPIKPWSTDYLRDYYINYHEGEEFDAQHQRGSGGARKKMFPMERIRPTLGQNLARLDVCGCRCSLLDLSGTVSDFFPFSLSWVSSKLG